MTADDVLVRLRGVSKDYHGLRPLRIAELDIRAGGSLALLGFDQLMAAVFVDLLTGAVLPDSGEISVFGQPTSAIADRDSWLTTLDQFGLFTERAVIVEQFTVEQNLALPLSIAVDGITPDVRVQVAALAQEVGLANVLDRQAATLPPAGHARIRLGRALALSPRVLLAEHPNAALSWDEATSLAADMSRVLSGRGIASAVITADRAFAREVAREVVVLEPATGALRPLSSWKRWFS